MTTSRFLIRRSAIALGLALAAGLLLAGPTSRSWAQSAPPQITSVTLNKINVVTGLGVTTSITFTSDQDTDGRVVYDTVKHDKTADYPFGSPVDSSGHPAFADGVLGRSHLVNLPFSPPTTPYLKFSTTYHYRLEVKNADGQITSSADRAFTTPKDSTGSSGTLVITGIRTDCVSVQCRVTFSTNDVATVEIRWDSVKHPSGNFGDYPSGLTESAAASGSRSLLIPPAANFAAGTQYFYRLQATKASASFQTGEFTLTTSSSLYDHIFATGTCQDPDTGDPVDIGSCATNREICTAGGLVQDCASICGFTCPAGQTCTKTGTVGQCLDDPGDNGSPYQCNKTNCFDPATGQFLNPAPFGCYSSWSICNANTILQVHKDRGCNLWLTCATSIQTPPTTSGPADNLCLALTACNSLGINGQCNHYLPSGQCSNDSLRFCSTDADCVGDGRCNTAADDQPTQSVQDLTYQTPEEVGKIADLSGNVIAGLDWHQQGGANVIQGALPWQLMRQIGGQSELINGDFEFNPPKIAGWYSVPDQKAFDFTGALTKLRVDFEDATPNRQSNNSNHVLVVEPAISGPGHCAKSTDTTTNQPLACKDSTGCTNVVGDTCVIPDVDFSGAASESFVTVPSEYYYAEARVKAPSGQPIRVRLQFGFDGYTQFVATNPDNHIKSNTYVDTTVTSAWQRLTLGPIKGMSGPTRVAVVCANNATCGNASFYVDDVQVRPVLQINTNPDYITPSCRLYPKDDSPACDYLDPNNVEYKGWRGYCLEHDSQTGTCLNWWPVDVIRGESNVFGSDQLTGYQDRAPLYLCAESIGQYGRTGTGYYQKFFTTFRSNDTSYILCSSCNLTQSVANSAEPDNPTEVCSNSDVTQQGLLCAFANNDSGSDTTALQVLDRDKDITETSIDNIRLEKSGDSDGTGYPNLIIVRQSSQDDGSCGGLYTGKPWSFSVTDQDPNDCLAARFEFDQQDHHLKNFYFHFHDGTSSQGFVQYRVSFVMRERCDKLVQVVNPSGDNAAFASRITSSQYMVPDLGYKQSTDYPPYGGVLPPAQGSLTPDTWPSLVYSEQPNMSQLDAPGQSRSGNPYSCNGSCADVVCTNDNVTCLNSDGSIDSAKLAQCQKDGGNCVGVPSKAADSRGDQLFSPTDNDPTNTGPATGTFSFYAQERIRRLFAQSYGLWTDLRCTVATTKACNSNADCQSGEGTCSLRADSYLEVTPSDFANADDSSFLGWKPPTTLCPLATPPGICSTSTLICKPATLVKGVSATGATQAEALTNANDQCIACDGTNPQCVGGTKVPYPSNDINCAQAGSTWTCSGTCTWPFNENKTYTKAISNSTAQPVPTRKPYPDDYCAVPPKVFNAAFLNNDSKAIVLSSGSGNIGLQFNTDADAEQQPLSLITVDWGDTQQPIPYRFAPRNSAQSPHVLSHAYAGATTKTYHIRIQVKDNWGWCNDTKTDASSKLNCSPNSGNWYDTGLTVKVTP